MDIDLINTAKKLLCHHFNAVITIAKADVLSEPERRNLILRLFIENPTDNIPASVILKKTAIENRGETEQEQLSRFAHDWAGLEFLTAIGTHHGPYFYAGSFEHRFILIEDLGLEHSSLVGPLTRGPSKENQEEAVKALAAYTRRVAQMHADTFGKTAQFEAILKRIYPEVKRFHYHKPDDINVLPKLFKRYIGYENEKLIAELNNIFTAMDSSDFKVLLHGDICPDNVFFQNQDIRLFDFEFGDTGHALIDGVYLRMSMPSCWCAKSTPANIVQQMEAIYRKELQSKIPAANHEDLYHQALLYACAYWVIRSLIWWLDEFFESDKNCPSGPVDEDSLWDPNSNGFHSRLLSRLEAFITCAQQLNQLPALCEASNQLLALLRIKWRDTQGLDNYPVFGKK
ncbi:MAG: phosphotransferase [Candidatus Berkiella sp.]